METNRAWTHHLLLLAALVATLFACGRPVPTCGLAEDPLVVLAVEAPLCRAPGTPGPDPAVRADLIRRAGLDHDLMARAAVALHDGRDPGRPDVVEHLGVAQEEAAAELARRTAAFRGLSWELKIAWLRGVLPELEEGPAALALHVHGLLL